MDKRWHLLVFALLIPMAFLSLSAHAATTLDSEQLAFVKLINNYRAQNGVGPLQVSAALQSSSQWMSKDMATKNYVSHTDSLGRNPFTRMTAFGYTHYPEGENIAAGYGDAQNTFNQWRDACDPDSTGKCTYAHRQNMLNSGFKVLGVGRAYNASAAYRWYWTTDFGGYVDATISTNVSTNTTSNSTGNSTNTTKVCYTSALSMPAKCLGGWITSNKLLSNGCRSIACAKGVNVSQAMICNKPGNYAPQYFEMYLQTYAGVPPKICLGKTCVGGNVSFVRSPNFPVCI